MNTKESAAHSRRMNASSRSGPRDAANRDHAIARLRHLTIGTTIASVAAVGVFGAVAAVSFPGGSANVTTAAVPTTGTATDPATSSTSGTTGLQPTAAPTATTPPTTATSRGAHATTGGS
jgi:hypothetical protein